MNGKEMHKLLEQNGWKIDRIRGSHHIFAKDGYIDVSVPIHGKEELRKGVQEKILKDSGLIEIWRNRKK